MFTQSLIAKINIAPFHAPGKKRPVSILNDPIGYLNRFQMFFPKHSPDAVNGAVHRRALHNIGYHLALLKSNIWTHNHPHIINLQTLTSVNTSNLVYRILRNDPSAAVTSQIPPHAKIIFRESDIVSIRGLLTDPVPAITSHKTGFIRLCVFFFDDPPEFSRIVHNAEIKCVASQPNIGRILYLKRVIQPGQIAIRSVAPELGLQLQPMYPCSLKLCPSGNDIRLPNILNVYLLVVIHKKQREFCCPDQFLHLILTLILV